MQVFVHPTPIAHITCVEGPHVELIPTAPAAASRAEQIADELRARGCTVVVTLPLRRGTNLRTSAPVQHM